MVVFFLASPSAPPRRGGSRPSRVPSLRDPADAGRYGRWRALGGGIGWLRYFGL